MREPLALFRHLVDHADVDLGGTGLEPGAGPELLGPGQHLEAEDVAIEGERRVEVVHHDGDVAVSGDGRGAGGHEDPLSVALRSERARDSTAVATSGRRGAPRATTHISIRRRSGSRSPAASPCAPPCGAHHHALEDARQLPVRERDVVLDLRQVAARRPFVARRDLGAGREPRRDRGGVVVGDHVVARLRRRREEIADVGERVAERAQLPVEHREHGAVHVDDAVPEPQVAVHDGALALLRDALGQELVHLLDAGQVARLRLLVLAVPAAELAADVVVLLREVAQSDGVDVDRVQRDVRVDDRCRSRAGARPRRACAARCRRR